MKKIAFVTKTEGEIIAWRELGQNKRYCLFKTAGHIVDQDNRVRNEKLAKAAIKAAMA